MAAEAHMQKISRAAVYPLYVKGMNRFDGLQLNALGLHKNISDYLIERPAGRDEYALVWCTEGEGWYILNGTRHEVKASNFFLLPANKAHFFGSAEGKSWSIYWMIFSGLAAPGFYSRLQGLQTLKSKARVDEIVSLFEEILSALESRADLDTAEYIDMVFPRLLSAFVYQDFWNGRKRIASESGNPAVINKACHYMNENIAEKISLKDICEHVGYSESHFTRLFTSVVGMTPMNYMNQMRASRAQRLLADTNLKINQIGEMVGMDDPYYFSKFFTKAVGCSPREYRKQLQW